MAPSAGHRLPATRHRQRQPGGDAERGEVGWTHPGQQRLQPRARGVRARQAQDDAVAARSKPRPTTSRRMRPDPAPSAMRTRDLAATPRDRRRRATRGCRCRPAGRRARENAASTRNCARRDAISSSTTSVSVRTSETGCCGSARSMICRTAGASAADRPGAADHEILGRVVDQRSVRHGRRRQIDLRLAVAFQPAHADVADHADDGGLEKARCGSAGRAACRRAGSRGRRPR